MTRLFALAVGPLLLTTGHGSILSDGPFLKTRGGASQNAKPKWLESMDRETVQKYMNRAKERHMENVQAARDAYWSAQETTPEDGTITSPPKVELDTYGVCSRKDSKWTLPDFEGELGNTIFVTRGAAGEDDTEATPLFEPQECEHVIRAANDYFAQHHGGEWTKLPSGQYNVAGFWIKDVPQVHEWFNEMVKTRLFPLLAKQFPDFCSDKDLVVDSSYLFKYTTETGKRTEIHTDSGCLSFTIAMGGDYEGGGTWIEGLTVNGKPVEDSLIEMKQGHVTVRPGGVRHCGHAVTSGTRYIIGGFCMHRKKVEYVRMLIGLGAELAEQGKYKEAQEALTASLVLNPNFDGAYSHLANVLQKQGKNEQAMDVLNHCLRHVNPYNGLVAYSLGVLCVDQQDYQKAKECLSLCLEVDDGDESAVMAYAHVCANLGDTEGERNCYEKIIQTPGFSTKARAFAYCNLGVLSEGDYETELKYYRSALKLDPNHFQARFSLAGAHAMQQQWKMAAESFRMAVDIASSEDNTSKALHALYKVAINSVHEAKVSTRQEQMQHLYEVMGEANFQKLVNLQRRQA